MKTYLGTKLLQAQPMSRADYNNYRNWVLPANEDGADAGYLVEYLDGGKPNDDRHAGYISWSPQAQFDAAYHEIPALPPGLAPHQQRVVIEHAELRLKYDKLEAFIRGPLFGNLRQLERRHLEDQEDVMGWYLSILNARIRNFKTS